MSDLELILTRLSNSNIQIYIENSSKTVPYRLYLMNFSDLYNRIYLLYTNTLKRDKVAPHFIFSFIINQLLDSDRFEVRKCSFENVKHRATVPN